MEALSAAREYCSDEIQIDWGSFAWKVTKEDLLKMKEYLRARLVGEKNLEDNVTYGVVFIEES